MQLQLSQYSSGICTRLGPYTACTRTCWCLRSASPFDHKGPSFWTLGFSRIPKSVCRFSVPRSRSNLETRKETRLGPQEFCSHKKETETGRFLWWETSNSSPFASKHLCLRIGRSRAPFLCCFPGFCWRWDGYFGRKCKRQSSQQRQPGARKIKGVWGSSSLVSDETGSQVL